ncbi:hypothetical protein EDD18DRAFT_1189008 [Armillaria luteobubalina]|uniref:DUF6535 domain-containing protein n=1 Tax=Armillaria luteobubalina TaxID=153913 RepID=A0AA39UHJ8_9AGAR|nr:hypothetical protein EDD18DRAFT_1189008 [Armillaria luteobubalina]
MQHNTKTTKNWQRPPNEPQGNSESPDAAVADSQPLALDENSAAYSLPRWRKLLRNVFGMQQRVSQVGRNDTSDYEQKFPEDKQYEELGPLARVWRTYLEECARFDAEMVEGWRDGLDVLLVFAGLFSAVVTTFVAQTSQSLQVDYSQVTASLLLELINVQRAAANGSLVNDVPRSGSIPLSDFRATTSDSLVNGLWFTSLSFSLVTALFVVLTKQWIHQYMAVSSGTPRDRCRVRQFRYMGLQQWRVAFIIGLLPVLMSASLFIFLVGLVVFLVPLKVSIASVVGAITFISFAAYFVTNFLPIIYPSCPYQTPLSQYILPLYPHITPNGIFTSVISPILRYWSEAESGAPNTPIHTLREAEHMAINLNTDEIDARAVSWLFSVASSPTVQRIVVESTGALPIRSVTSVQRCAEGLSSLCAYTLKELLDDARQSDGHVNVNKIDRCIRAHLRFRLQITHIPVEFFNMRDELAPGLRAELLAADIYEHRQQIRDLIVATLRAPPDRQSLRLQPVVWAHLIFKIEPFDREVYELLFHALPAIYWRADYERPPHFDPKWGLPISTAPAGDRPETLLAAISDSLFASIGDILLEGCADFEVRDGTSYNDFTFQFSIEPNDPRVRFLLNMAGSPSIRRMNALHSSPGTFFSAVLHRILLYMGVENRTYYKCVFLDNNSSAISRLLYVLVSLDEGGVGSDSVSAEDQRTTLITFFRVHNCISPRLPEDSFPAELTAKFASIAFQDDIRSSTFPSGAPPLAKEAVELVIHLFEHSFTMNAAFAHFVDKKLFDSFPENYNAVLPIVASDLSEIIGAFVAGLSSGKLDPQICRRSLEYLHEPESLYTACATLLAMDNTTALHQLVLLRCNDSAWPQCLQSLQEVDLHAFIPYHTIGRVNQRLAYLETDIEQNRELETVIHRCSTIHDVRSVRENNEPTKSAWSKVKFPLLLSRWARQNRTGEVLTEEVAMSRIGDQV